MPILTHKRGTLLRLGLIAALLIAEYSTQFIYQSIGRLCLNSGNCVNATVAPDYETMLNDAVRAMTDVSGTMVDSTTFLKDLTPDSLSPYLLDAIILNEDPNFGRHHGTDYSTLLKSAYLTSKSFFQPQYQEIYGGSTISEQLAKMRFDDPFESSRETRLERIIVSSMQYQQLAATYGEGSVDQKLLLAYLNFFDFENGAIGVEKASQVYFSKSASGLDLAEAVALATCYKNSYYYNPLNAASPDGFLERTIGLLDEMVSVYGIDQDVAYQARSELEEMHRMMIEKRLRDAEASILSYDPVEVRQSLDAELMRAKEGLPDDAQIYIRLEDLEKGTIYQSGGSEQVPALSLIKIPIMVSAYRKASEMGVDLGDYVFDSAPTDNFYGLRRGMLLEPIDSLKETLGFGGMQNTGYDWISSMINISSNTAANSILRWLGDGDIGAGIDYVNETSGLMGLDSTSIYHRLKLMAENQTGNTTSVDDLSIMLQGIYRHDLQGLNLNENDYDAMIRILEKSDFSFIKEGLPPGTLGGSKMGFDAELQAETAVVNRNYVLTIYLKGVRIEDSGVIKDISSIVYGLLVPIAP